MWPYDISGWKAISHPIHTKKKKTSIWKKLVQMIQETQTKRAEYRIKYRLFS